MRISPHVALGGITVGAVAVAGLWWQDTDFVYGLGSWLTNAGRITGLAAGYAILVVLALMARVPALDRGVGSDRLARWHAAGGRYTVCLAVAHTLLIIWGYAVTAHAGVVPESVTLVLDYPDVLMATAGLGLFLLVGVTSARAARRRLRYETWHLLHLYTYLAIALVFSHQFATGADFTDARARVLWAGMYIVVGAVLVWYRLITPLVNLSRHSLRVVAVVPHGGDIVSVVFAGRNIARLDPRAGTVLPLAVPDPRPVDGREPLLVVRGAGRRPPAHHREDCRRAQCRPRRGPPGHPGAGRGPVRRVHRRQSPTPPGGARHGGKVLLVGVGVGITPVRALFETIPAAPGDLTLVYRARTPGDLVLRDELEHIAARRGARIHYLLGPREQGGTAALTAQRLKHLVPDLTRHDVYLCGPDALTAQLSRDLRRAGLPRRAVHAESFTL